MHMCAAALRSACSYQSSLAAVTHPGTPYLLKVAQAAEGDMKCIPAQTTKHNNYPCDASSAAYRRIVVASVYVCICVYVL